MVCSPGDPAVVNTCQAASAMRAQICAAADHVDVDAGTSTSVSGETGGASLWDAPSGCSAHDPTGRPEGVVMVTVSEHLASLSLSTDVAATSFDTVLYVMDACSSPDPALACGDDGDDTVAGSVTLADVAPGTYAVVIDSFGPDGGRFGLAIEAH
jgi:hypothetical protein